MSDMVASDGRPTSGVTARLGLTLLTLVAAVALIGGTAATISAWTVNPGATFSATGPELSAQVGGGVPCVASGNAVSCGDLFGHRVVSGESQSIVVTIRNTGNVPVNTLQMWSSGCRQGARSLPFSGTSDLCGATWLTIHDDLHNVCYFPTAAAGACQFQARATLADFALRHGPGSPIDLSSEGLASGTPFSFAIQLDPAAGNDYQGRWAELSITWQGA